MDEQHTAVEQPAGAELLPGWTDLAAEVAQELTAWRAAHPRATLAELEAVVWEAGQRLQARALAQLVQASACADLAAQPVGERPRCPQCGGRLEPRGQQRRTLQPARQRVALTLARSYAVCRTCGVGLSPLDEELGLVPGELSATLAEGVVRLGTQLPFAQAAAEVAFFWGVELEETTVRRHTEAAGAAYVAVQRADLAQVEDEESPARAQPSTPAGPALQYLSADGAMVPLVGGTWAEVKTLAIGTIEHLHGEDGLLEAHTTELSYFSRLADAETFTRQAYVETYRRGTERAEVVCAVQDGAEWVQGLVDSLRPDAVRILDFPHAVEYLTKAAQAVWGPTAPETAAWLASHAHTLKHAADGAHQVLRALARLPVDQATDPTAAAEMRETALGYLTKRLPQLQYAAFRAADYPIGSGSTESANKVVVEARLKGRGMHWARAHINPLVALRTVACANRWAEAWPRIVARLRQDAAHRRRARWQARHTPATTGPMLAASPPPPPQPLGRPRSAPRGQPPQAAAPAPPRGKLVVHGCPTAWHPWKRYPCLPGGRRPRPAGP